VVLLELSRLYEFVRRRHYCQESCEDGLGVVKGQPRKFLRRDERVQCLPSLFELSRGVRSVPGKENIGK
jgi:hypothetical protein